MRAHGRTRKPKGACVPLFGTAAVESVLRVFMCRVLRYAMCMTTCVMAVNYPFVLVV